MADGGSSLHSSETEDDYDFSASTSLSSEASEEMLLSNPSLEMEVQPYCFKPDLPASTDRRKSSSHCCFQILNC